MIADRSQLHHCVIDAGGAETAAFGILQPKTEDIARMFQAQATLGA